jgi:hypothetical protein
MNRCNKGREDMTIEEMLADPLIGLMLRADGLCTTAFAELLETAARELDMAKAPRQAPVCRVTSVAAELSVVELPMASLDE